MNLSLPCINCGRPACHLHHAIPKSICEAGRHEHHNLIDLCPDCHSGWHDGSVVIYREALPDDVLDWVALHASEGWLAFWYPTRDLDWSIF